MSGLIKTLVCLIAFLFSGTAGGAEAGIPSVYKTVDGRALQLFVEIPQTRKTTEMCPAIVFFHGGGIRCRKKPACVCLRVGIFHGSPDEFLEAQEFLSEKFGRRYVK